MRPPAARPDITMPYHENRWELLFLHVQADAIRCSPLSPSAPHGKSYGYWKTFENHWKTSFLHVWQKHFQRVRMVCPVRCTEKLEWPCRGGAEKA